MTYSLPSELIPRVELIDGVAVTSSRDIAKYFDKEHKNVLQSIREVCCSEEFTRLNFQLCYENSELQNGKPLPFYRITKDGFFFLVMGFTGEKAALIKEAYIQAFNQMEAQLHKPTVSSIEAETESTVWLKKYVTLQEKYSELQEKYIALQEKLQTHELKNATVESPKPLRRRRLTEEMIQQILELYQQGYTQTEIARVVGYSTATISVVVRQRRNH